MASTSIVTPCPESPAQEQPNDLENISSHTDIQATDTTTDVETRLAAARARREYDLTLRTSPRTIEHIRQLIALECGRVDRTPMNGACAKDCGSKICDMFGCMLDDRAPSSGGVA